MPRWRRSTLLTLLCLVIFLGWGLDAAAHRRAGLTLTRPDPPPDSQPTPPLKEKTSGPLSLTPEAYWKRLKAQEKAKEMAMAQETGLALVNLFPQNSQREATLLTLAHLAKQQGEQKRAQELYALVACWQPGTAAAAKARLAAAHLEFSRDLEHGDPVRTLRRFLEKMAALPPGYPPEALQESLKVGWQAVAQKVRATSNPSLLLVEEVLALWELQPQDARPMEAALLLADLLKEHGLLEEAQALLTRMGKRNNPLWQSKLKSHSLELAWLSRGWEGLTDTLQQASPGKEEQKFLLRSWLSRREADGPPPPADWATTTCETLLPWFLPQTANAAGLEIQEPALQQAFQHSWPAPVTGRLQAELARRYWSQGDFSRAAQLYQMMAENSVSENLTPFYQDRLGLSRLKEGQWDAAQAVFHGLVQHGDPFWQRLARVRLGDLELARLRQKPSP